MILSLAAFLVVSLLIIVGHQLLSGWLNPDSARVSQRIAEEFGGDTDQATANSLYKNIDQLKLDSGFDPRAAEEVLPAPPKLGMLDATAQWLEQAQLPISPGQFFFLMSTISLLVGFAATWWAGLFAGLFAASVGAAAPVIYVSNRRSAYIDKYLRQLPNAFELMARVIRAGQTVQQALQAVADAFEKPLAVEFGQCLQQQSLGMRPEITFQKMAERSGILEMRIFAMAMHIQRETGGNLSDVLERLAGLIRTRVKLKMQVRTLTAEGRMQGWTLAVLPFLIFAVMMVINREYAEVLFQHVPLLIGTMISVTVGLLWIRKIVNIEG